MKPSILGRKRLNYEPQINQWMSPVNRALDGETKQLLVRMTLFSTTLFVFSTLLVRFLLNLFTSILIKLHSLDFQYGLFDIRFLSMDGSKWPISRTLLIFGSAYLLFSIAGILLGQALKNMHNVNWKTRLFLTWIAILMVYTLPAGILSGVLVYTHFGIAFHWLIPDIFTRGLIAVLVFALVTFFEPYYWVFLFLKAAPSSIFFKDENQKLFIKNVFIKSWLFGFFILLLFNRPLLNGFWPAFTLSLGVILIPLILRPSVYENIYIRKSEKEVFTSRFSIPLIIFILAIIGFACSFRINV